MSYGKEILDDSAYERYNSRRESSKKKSKRPLFTRGYDESRDRLNNNSYYSRSCFNCAYYYQEHGDKEEMCQNDRVLEYDMVVEGNTIYCLHWKQSSIKSDKDSMFNRRGRSLLD